MGVAEGVLPLVVRGALVETGAAEAGVLEARISANCVDSVKGD